MKKTTAIRFISMLLLVIFLFPISVTATEARASYYLDAYSAYVYPAGWGKIQVWFSVDGTNYMDEVGALQIQLYESTDNVNWTWVKTFDHTDYPDMLAYDKDYHDGHVEYSGTLGRYYRAYVCVWAGENGSGDTRYFWTNIEKATLFAG